MSFRKPVKQRGIDVEESRRKREYQVFGFQKQQRDELVNKERSKLMRVMTVMEQDEDFSVSGDSKLHQLVNITNNKNNTCVSSDSSSLLPILYRLGHQLSLSEIGIQQVIDLQLVPILISLLQKSNNTTSLPKMQALVLWSLSTLASGTREQAQTILKDKSVLPITIRLMQSDHHDVRKRAVWLLANLALGCCDFRNTLLQHGILEQATDLLFRTDNGNCPDDLACLIYWLVSSLFSYTSRLPKEYHPVFSSVNAILLQMLDYPNFLYAASALQILVNLTLPSLIDEQDSDQLNAQVSFMQTFVELCGLTRLIKLLRQQECLSDDNDEASESRRGKMILTVIGRLVVCSDDDFNFTEAVLQCRDLLPCLVWCAAHPDVELRQLVWWIVGNLVLGNPRHIQVIVSYEPLIQSMVQAATRQEYCVQKEIACTLCNVLAAGALDQILPLLLHRQAIEIICNNQLEWHEPDFVVKGLKTLERILLVTETNPMLHLKIKETMEKCRGLDVVESLQNSENDAIYKQVRQVLSYWECDCVDEENSITTNCADEKNSISTDCVDGNIQMDDISYVAHATTLWQSQSNSSVLMSY